MRQISIEDRTFELLTERARGEGFAGLPEYLDSLATKPDEFEMTTEIEAALEKGLEDIRAGHIVSENAVREGVEKMRIEWHEKRH